jgi:hypothetical protein
MPGLRSTVFQIRGASNVSAVGPLRCRLR